MKQFCCGCKQGLTQEQWWMFTVERYHEGRDLRRFLCKTCAPTQKAASEFFQNRKFSRGKLRGRLLTHDEKVRLERRRRILYGGIAK